MTIFSERVSVLNQKNKHISYVHPARARKLLKKGKAETFSTKPFTIKLKGEKRGKKMVAITNFTEYFRGDDRDVYVRNVCNNQVSLQFEISTGRTEHVLIPKTRDPFNLTQHVPFDAIKRSTDIRKLVNRRPPALELLTSEEYEKYYEGLAKRKGTSKEEEIIRALELQTSLMERRPPVSDDKPKSMDDIKKERTDNDEVDEEQPLPRIIGLCSQVGAKVEKDQKLNANEMMNELESMESELRPTDFEYIASNGYYKIVKKWANKRYSETSESEE